MLWFGAEPVLNEFRKVIPSLSTRLIISLGNAAEIYFDTSTDRSVSIITGQKIEIAKNIMLFALTTKKCQKMAAMVQSLLLDALKIKYAVMPKPAASHIYIDPALDSVIVPVSDRSTTIQDVGSAMRVCDFRWRATRCAYFSFGARVCRLLISTSTLRPTSITPTVPRTAATTTLRHSVPSTRAIYAEFLIK